MSGIDLPGGGYRMGGLRVPRFGYGAMQPAGPGVFGPPKDRAGAVEVLRTAVEAGIRHIDTADFYGPHVTNEIIREALAPYPEDLRIATGVKKSTRLPSGSRPSRDRSPQGISCSPAAPGPRRNRPNGSASTGAPCGATWTT